MRRNSSSGESLSRVKGQIFGMWNSTQNAKPNFLQLLQPYFRRIVLKDFYTKLSTDSTQTLDCTFLIFSYRIEFYKKLYTLYKLSFAQSVSTWTTQV